MKVVEEPDDGFLVARVHGGRLGPTAESDNLRDHRGYRVGVEIGRHHRGAPAGE